MYVCMYIIKTVIHLVKNKYIIQFNMIIIDVKLTNSIIDVKLIQIRPQGLVHLVKERTCILLVIGSLPKGGEFVIMPPKSKHVV